MLANRRDWIYPLTITRYAVALVALGVLVSPSLPLLAQELEPKPGMQRDSEGGESQQALEHTLIFGEKIERSYLETFSSVGIVTADDFKQFDISDTGDAYRRLANVRQIPQAGGNSIQIRGLAADGVTQPSNSAALISIVIDGVTQSPEALKRGARGVWDAEQLEVYRGPQSTTQGRNALAGTVVIKTKDPTFEPEYSVKGIYGELDRQEAAVAISGPIFEDELAFRLTGEYSEYESDIKVNDPGNKKFIKDDYYTVRGKLLYQPKQFEGLEALLTLSHAHDSPTTAPVSGPDFFERIYDASSAFAETREMNLKNYSADIGYALNPGLTLRSVSAYHDTGLEIRNVPTSEVFFRDEDREDDDFTQEFRLEINEAVAGFTGVAGLFYGSFDNKSEGKIAYSGNVFQDGLSERNTETWAAYADLRFRLLDQFDFILGGRYQDDAVKTSREGQTSAGSLNGRERSDFDEFLPKAGVSWNFSQDQTVAVIFRRGYRQGYSGTRVAAGGGSEVYAVKPEYVWTYEVAYRQTALDSRLRFGANAFYNDYEDQQINVVNIDIAPLPFTLNAGDSKSYGAELEANADLGGGFTGYASLGLLRTELGEFPDESCTGGSCSGNSYSQAPEVTASLGGAYAHASGFFASLASDYTGQYYQNIDNNSDLEIDDAFLVNVVVGYEFSHFRVSAYAKNLFDEDYLLAIYSENSAVVGDGRAVGLEVQADF